MCSVNAGVSTTIFVSQLTKDIYLSIGSSSKKLCNLFTQKIWHVPDCLNSGQRLKKGEIRKGSKVKCAYVSWATHGQSCKKQILQVRKEKYTWKDPGSYQNPTSSSQEADSVKFWNQKDVRNISKKSRCMMEDKKGNLWCAAPSNISNWIIKN